MSLCRHYVRELRRSILVATPDLEHGGSKRSSQVLDMGEMQHSVAGPSYMHTEAEKNQNAQMSAFLREDRAGNSPHGSVGSKGSAGMGVHKTSSNEIPPRPSFVSTQLQVSSDSHSPANAVARQDIRASAEKILYTYLLPGSDREIVLPHSIIEGITTAIEVVGRDDPEVFDAAKDYVFQAMERDAFPNFLSMKALGNLMPTSCMIRLIIGLLSMFGGFWAAFALIFLNASRLTRCWLILPFSIGIYCLTTHQYRIDPILALANFSERAFMKFTVIREPYIARLMKKRARVVIFVDILLTVVTIVLFVFVPGKRL